MHDLGHNREGFHVVSGLGHVVTGGHHRVLLFKRLAHLRDIESRHNQKNDLLANPKEIDGAK